MIVTRILLSTHIMSEVEAVCGRVIIIAKEDRGGRPARSPPNGEPSIVLEKHADPPRRSGTGSNPCRTSRATSFEPSFEGEYATVRDPDRRMGPISARQHAHRVVQNWLRRVRQLDIGRTTLEDRFIQAVTRETISAEAELEAV